MLRVEARLTLLATEEGGRRTYCTTGYRPTIRFGTTYTESSFEFAENIKAMPGDECHVYIQFINPSFVRQWLVEGQEFDVTEGSRKIGHGRIISIEPET